MSLKILFNRSKFYIVKNAPKILTALGISCYAASVVTTVKSTNKFEERIAADADKLRELKASLQNKEAINMGEIVVKDVKREMLKTSLHTVGTTLKVYAPSIILFATGTGCILGANSIMYKRQAALTAAYGALNTTFSKYRQRVADKYGAEAEKAIRQGAEAVKDPKTGEVTYNQTAPQQDVELDWSVVVDDTCGCWTHGDTVSTQMTYLLYLQQTLQDKLETEGFLFLEDVYKALGVNLTNMDNRKLQGMKVVGWIFKKGIHESHIDFGLIDPRTGNRTENYYKCAREGRNCIWIELNPEGDILTGNGGRPTYMDFLKNK